MLRFVLSALVLAGCVTPGLAEYKLEIGPDTTVIDGPMNPDGTINYLAYLNEIISEGVTPENNFAVDVAMSMHPNLWPSPTYRDHVLKKLSVTGYSEDQCFITLPDFVKSPEVDYSIDQKAGGLESAAARPWKTSEFPTIRRWLDLQAGYLDRFVKDANKTEFYFPKVVEEGKPDMLSLEPIQWFQQVRGIMWGLAVRAQWRIQQGDLEGAWADTMALRKMARLIKRERILLPWLVGISVERHADRVVPYLASSKCLTPGLAQKMVLELNGLHPSIRMVDTYDFDERFYSIDMVMHCAKGRGQYLSEFDLLDLIDDRAISLMSAEEYDPNVTLRAINRFVNDLTDASNLVDYRERQEAISRVEDERSSLRDQAGRVLDPEHEISETMDRLIKESNVSTAVATNLLWYDSEWFSFAKIDQTQTHHDAVLELVPVVLAIGGYHAEHGEYPPDLQALVPAYLDDLPTDFATGKLPVYRVEEGMAIIYSLGTNLKDDGGVDDNEDGDIVFRIER